MKSTISVPLQVSVHQGVSYDPQESVQLRVLSATSFDGLLKVLVAERPLDVPMGREELLEKQLAESVRLHQKMDAKLQSVEKELTEAKLARNLAEAKLPDLVDALQSRNAEIQHRIKRENDLNGKYVILEGKHRNLQAELAESNRNLITLERAHDELERLNKHARNAQHAAMEERDKIEQQLQHVAGQLDAARANVGHAEGQVKVMSGQLAVARSQLSKMEQTAIDAKNRYRECETAYQTKERQYAELADVNRKLNESLALANGARDHVQKRLTNAITAHEKTIAALEEEAAEALHRARRPEETVVTFIVKAIKQRYSQQPQFAAPLANRPVDVAADIRAIVRDELQRMGADDGK